MFIVTEYAALNKQADDKKFAKLQRKQKSSNPYPAKTSFVLKNICLSCLLNIFL